MKKIVTIAIAVFASIMVIAAFPRFAQATVGSQYQIFVTAKSGTTGNGLLYPVNFTVTYTHANTTYTDVTNHTEWYAWIDENTNVTVSAPQQIVPNETGVDGVRYRFSHYGPHATINVTGNGLGITLWYVDQYLLTVKTNGLPNGFVTLVYLDGSAPTDDYGIGVIADGSANGYRKWFDATPSFTPTIGVDSTVNGAAGTVYNFDHWSDGSTTNPHSAMALTGPISLTANYAAISLPVPEYWLGPILGLTGCFAALGVFRLARHKHP